MCPLKECFEKENFVKIFTTEKANGENFQVSYCKDAKSWVISSKNVSILARKLADIELYENKDLWIIKEDKIEKKVKKEQNTKEKKEKKSSSFLNINSFN